MRLARFARGPLLGACLLALPIPLTGCGIFKGGTHPVVASERKTPASAQVTDDGFAGAVHDLLVSEPGSHERQVRLAGVEARQMARAAIKFRDRAVDQGLAHVVGGLYLMRTGELSADTLGATAADAIRPAAREAANRGDEGRARALYGLLVNIGTDADRADAKSHLDAIASWMKDSTATSGPVAAAGARERAAVHRYLLEPSQAAMDEAAAASGDWFKKANQLRLEAKAMHQPPPREEGIEAYRALQTGAAVIVSIYLRNGDANGALQALEKYEAHDMLYPELGKAIDAAADTPDALRWRDVLHAMRPLLHHEGARDEDDFSDDRDLFRAAAFGVAATAYRLDPTLPEPAIAIAALLQDFGMAEVTPAIVYEAARAHPDAKTLQTLFGMTMYSMELAVQASDVDAARRTFAAAQPLLQIGDAHANAKMTPTSARVRAMMGQIELNDGRIDEARTLLTSAASTEKSAAVLFALAQIDRHDGKLGQALGRLRDALSAPDAQRDLALKGELLLLSSDIARDAGDQNAVRGPLDEALRDLNAGRAAGEPDQRARVERVLAKVLDRFGEDQLAQKALERAFEAAPRDKDQASQTLSLMVGRALVRGDLNAAHDGLKRAIASDLSNDDLVYYALWTRLLEKQMHATTDGAADRVFASIPESDRWVSKLAAFGAGKLRGEDLIAAAKTPSQKTEALFYEAMDKRVAGDAKASTDYLRQVLAAPGVQLQEVSLARDLLAGSSMKVGQLPAGVVVQ